MMLAELEKKTAALIADYMAGRTHLSVVAAPGPPSPADDGLEVAVVSIAEASTGGGFRAERFVSQINPPQSRRVLPLSIVAGIDFALRPADAAAGLAAARSLLLEDVSLVSHFLAGDGILGGGDFTIADPDPGLQVRSFRVTKDLVDRDVQQGLLTARIECRGDVEIWPPDQASQEGVIDAIRRAIVPQPIEILPLQPVVPMGGRIRLKVRGLPVLRVVGPPAEPFAFSLRVLSDVPPEQRGTITSGATGAETGSRVVNVAGQSTDVEYVAPTANVRGTRVEFVSVHFAMPDGRAGAFLGSVAVRVTGGNG
jgi:hypothetical protein